MKRKLKRAPSLDEMTQFFFTGKLQIGDIVRSAPKAALDYPYAGGIHDKRVYWGTVKEWKSAGRDSDGWESVNPVVICFDGEVVHRHYNWWVVVNERELQWLKDKYNNIPDCKRVRKNRIRDYDPLLKVINSPSLLEGVRDILRI